MPAKATAPATPASAAQSPSSRKRSARQAASTASTSANDGQSPAPKRSKRNAPSAPQQSPERASLSATPNSPRSQTVAGVDTQPADGQVEMNASSTAEPQPSVTESLLKAGAQPITDLDRQFGLKFVERATSTNAPPATGLANTFESESLTAEQLAKLKDADPSAFVTHFWRQNIAKHHLPRWEFYSLQPTKFSCSLFVYMPPKHSRAYTAEGTYASKDAARDAASRTAIRDGAPERAKAARSLAGNEANDLAAQGVSGSHFETVENPVGVLHEAVQKYAIEQRPSYEYTIDRLTDLHGVIITCPVSPRLSQTWQVDPVFLSRKEAKDAVTRLALKNGIMETYSEHARTRQPPMVTTGSNGPARAVSGSKLPSDVQKDAIEVLNREAVAAFGSVKCLKWSVTHAYKALEGNSESTLVSGVDLHVALGPLKTRVFSIEPSFLDLNHARTAVASKALSEGILDEIRAHATQKAVASQVGAEAHLPLTQPFVASAAPVSAEQAETMPDPVSYLNLFMQKWTATTAPLAFDYAQVHGGFSCTLKVVVRGQEYSYASPFSFPSKKLAKEAAVRTALREGVTSLVRPAGAGFAQTPAAASSAAKTPPSVSGLPESGQAVPTQPLSQIGNAVGSTCMEQLDKLFDDYSPDGSLPDYTTQRDPQTGLFGAQVQIPTPDGAKTVTVTPNQPSRLAAQEAVAVQVFRQGLHKQFKQLWQQANPPKHDPARPEDMAGPFASKIVSVCEVLFDEDGRRPVFTVSSRSDNGPFGAAMSLQLSQDNVIETSITSEYETRRNAVEAVAQRAIQDESVLAKIKAAVAVGISQGAPASSVDATAPSGPPTPTANTRPTARSLYEAKDHRQSPNLVPAAQSSVPVDLNEASPPADVAEPEPTSANVEAADEPAADTPNERSNPVPTKPTAYANVTNLEGKFCHFAKNTQTAN
ncbi:hypothetical protein OIV83_004452 [Microbotryomycetes sp. JL201]|nr:hypothetical protein OIV83_004452 [Microbotryomycetes sp. JL201]